MVTVAIVMIQCLWQSSVYYYWYVSRYRALSRLEEDRKVILLNHLGFTQNPSREQCAFREDCMEAQVSRVLATKAHR